jgi:hypothetical protein
MNSSWLPLCGEDKDRYCAEASAIERHLGIPEGGYRKHSVSVKTSPQGISGMMGSVVSLPAGRMPRRAPAWRCASAVYARLLMRRCHRSSWSVQPFCFTLSQCRVVPPGTDWSRRSRPCPRTRARSPAPTLRTRPAQAAAPAGPGRCRRRLTPAEPGVHAADAQLVRGRRGAVRSNTIEQRRRGDGVRVGFAQPVEA